MIQHYEGQDYCLRCGGPANTFSCPECDGVEYTGNYYTPSEVIDPCWEHDENYNPAPWYDRLCYWLKKKMERLSLHYQCWGLRIDKYVMWRWRRKTYEEEIPF